jgi:hypothetical protein
MVTEIHHCPEASTAPESVHPLLARKGDHIPAVRCPATISRQKVKQKLPKVCGPYVLIHLNWTPIFEWQMACCYERTPK